MSEPKTLKQRTAKGIFWGGISNFIQQAVGMIFGIFIARILSPEDYGLVAMLAIFTSVISSLMDGGFSSALINRPTIEHRDYNAVFWFNILVSIGVYIVLFFFAPLIANFYRQPVLVDLSRILFLSFIFSSAGLAHNAFLVKKIMAKQRGFIDIVAVGVAGLVGLVLALKGFASWGLVIMQLVQTLTGTLLRWYFVRWKPTFRFDFTPLREMFSYGIKLTVTTIAVQVENNLISVILGRAYGKTDVGYYAQGSKWAIQGSSVLVAALNSVAHPILAETRDDRERQLNVFRKMVRFGALITFPSLFGLMLTGYEFIVITLGVKWLSCVPFLQLFCLWGVCYNLTTIYTSLALSHGKSSIYMNITIAVFGAQLIVLFLCHHFVVGILLMTTIYILVFGVSILFWHHCTARLIDLSLRDMVIDIAPYLLAVSVAIFLAWLAANPFTNVYLRFAIKTIVTASVYVAILKITHSDIFDEALVFLKSADR